MDGKATLQPWQRERIDHIVAFHADLVKLREMLRAANDDTALGLGGTQVAEFETFRQLMLRRAGPVQAVFERVYGARPVRPLRIDLPGPWPNIWDAALQPSYGLAHVALMELPDLLSVLVGILEDNPSQLDAPKPAPSAAPALQPINVYGGTVNIAQTGSGDVTQTIGSQPDAAEVKRLLTELEDAIRQVQAPEDELENFLEPVEQLTSELAKPRPLISRLTRSWGAIQAFAAINGAWTGWDRVQHIAGELGPKAHDLIQALAKAMG